MRGIDPVTGEPKANFAEYVNLHFKPEDNKQNLADGYIETLKAMSPSKRKRFYLGEYGTAVGLVYELTEDHIVDDFEIPKNWDIGRGVDFGYTHKFAFLWTAYDKANETLYVFREWVRAGWTVAKHSEKILELSGDEQHVFTVADHNAEDRATMAEHGIDTTSANKSVTAGIDILTDHLERVKIKIFRSCPETIGEFYAYRWKDSDKLVKDREVIKENDDCLDTLRYIAMEWFFESVVDYDNLLAVYD